MIYRNLPTRVVGCLTLIAVLTTGATIHAAQWESLFNGKNLSGWKGKPEFWRVEDGTITGETTAEKKTKGNTFLIWQGGEIGNFELKLKYRIVGGNSGIQYRSFEVEPDSFVVGGYQADFEAGTKYSGIVYGEKFRGILSLRGEKSVFTKEGKRKTVEKIGDPAELQKTIKPEKWNNYHIIADGFTFTHKINGQVMTVLTDEHEAQRRAKGILALQLHAGPPMKVQFKKIRLKRLGGDDTVKKTSGLSSTSTFSTSATAEKKKRICFVAGTKSHGYGAHEHNAGCMLLAKCLNESGLRVEAVVHKNGWPEDASFFDGADAIVMYCDGGKRHFANAHLDQINALAKKGVGISCIHYGVETILGQPGDRFMQWIGGYFELDWSVNPHWTAHYKQLPKHAIARGVKPFSMNDEWYYHMRFRPGMKGVTPLLTALPPKETLKRPDGEHSGNPEVRKAVIDRKEPQHTAWCSENENGGRGFGFTGGHFHWNWGQPDFRKLVLNAIYWTAKGQVPKAGVKSSVTKVEELTANQDESPRNFDAAAMQAKLDEWNDNNATILPFGFGGSINMLYDCRQRPQAVYLNEMVYIGFKGGGTVGKSDKAKTRPMLIRYDPQRRRFSKPLTLGKQSSDHGCSARLFDRG